MTRRPPAPPAVWSESIGLLPHRVIAEEVPSRRGGIYLRWWNPTRGNWDKKSLGNIRQGKPLRDAKGRVSDDVAQWAVQAATRQYLINTGGAAPAAAKPAEPFAIGKTWAAISDAERGKYPHRTQFRDELQRALEYASTVWGGSRSWESIEEEDWSSLIRRRVTELVARGHVGVRATEITVSRLVTASTWLRKTKRIPAGAAAVPDDWKADLVSFWKGLTKSARDPQPNRPRYTQAESLAILAVAWTVDPRFGLLIDVGAEYRLGQVARCRRSDLNLDEGTLEVHGAGKKGGEIIELTDGQMRSVRVALAGYLAAGEKVWLADAADYDLFPGGRLRRWRVSGVQTGKWGGKKRTVSTNAIRKWFRRAEGLARVDGQPIKHVDGRGAYGIRRQHVKIANDEGISRFGLRAAGGWSSTKIPDEVYDEQENRRGRAEAKVVRARWRREDEPPKADDSQATNDDAVHTSSALSESTADDLQTTTELRTELTSDESTH